MCEKQFSLLSSQKILCGPLHRPASHCSIRPTTLLHALCADYLASQGLSYCGGPQKSGGRRHQGAYTRTKHNTTPVEESSSLHATLTRFPAFCVTPYIPTQAMSSVEEADISPQNLVVRFGESVDGFPLPKGHSHNQDLQAEQQEGAEAFLKDR